MNTCVLQSKSRALRAQYASISIYTVLGGSWVVISGVISRVTIVETHIRDL